MATEIEGEIVIRSLPETPVTENTESFRRLWIGCTIPGILLTGVGTESKIIFKAWLGRCFEALHEKHGSEADAYIAFWRKHFDDWEKEEFERSKREPKVWHDMRLGHHFFLGFDPECFVFRESRVPGKGSNREFLEMYGFTVLKKYPWRPFSKSPYRCEYEMRR